MKEEKPLSFIKGTLKDGVLDYSYLIKAGVGVGNTHKVNGTGLFMDSLAHAFAKLNVHLAAIDDVFKHSNTEVENINKMRTDELTLLYTVEGFNITVTADEESVVLVGRAMRPHPEKDSAWIVDLGGNIKLFGKIETMKIETNEKGLYYVSNNGRQLTNVLFTKT